ncbi:unnamed protein product [Cyclocybe aegerita]|uniref:Uncharacterized protein n=1 Tax=Cyclocybe aegerita TaxID=1973307 RepID=A0A8S0VQ39_CYCAE|nr:unnamed protein product [Cyclocybe aegerita]
MGTSSSSNKIGIAEESTSEPEATAINLRISRRFSKYPKIPYDTYVKAILCQTSKELLEFGQRVPKSSTFSPSSLNATTAAGEVLHAFQKTQTIFDASHAKDWDE